MWPWYSCIPMSKQWERLQIWIELGSLWVPTLEATHYYLFQSLIACAIRGDCPYKVSNLDSLWSISSLVCMQICVTKFMETEILEPLIWFEKKRRTREFDRERKNQNKTRRNVEKEKETLFFYSGNDEYIHSPNTRDHLTVCLKIMWHGQ